MTQYILNESLNEAGSGATRQCRGIWEECLVTVCGYHFWFLMFNLNTQWCRCYVMWQIKLKGMQMRVVIMNELIWMNEQQWSLYKVLLHTTWNVQIYFLLKTCMKQWKIKVFSAILSTFGKYVLFPSGSFFVDRLNVCCGKKIRLRLKLCPQTYITFIIIVFISIYYGCSLYNNTS